LVNCAIAEPKFLSDNAIPPRGKISGSYANAALIKSGTSSLEMAVAGIPHAVAYKMNPITAAIARRLIKVPHVSLVNLLAEREGLCVLEFWQRGKLLLGEAEDFEKALAAADRGDVFRVDVDLHLGGGKLADDVGKPPRGQRGGAGFLNLRVDAATDADVGIGRGQAELTVGGVEEDVGKDGERGAGADDVLHSLQTCEELLFADAKFHRGRSCV